MFGAPSRARTTAFRASPSAVAADRPSRRQALVLLVALLLVAGTVAAVSYAVRPDRARAFDLFHGSLFLSDALAPVAVDLASGRPTVRLIDAGAQVGASNADGIAVTPLSAGTLLLNRATGEFNLVAATGFVVKTDGGVPIAPRAGATGAIAVASGNLAYIEQTGPTGTSVYLVGQTTVETASNVDAKVRPRAFRAMAEAGTTTAGAAASGNGDLWLLLGSGTSRVIRRLAVPANSSSGATLTSTDHGRVSGAAAIASAAEHPDGTGPDVLGVASADRIQVFGTTGAVATARFARVAGLDSVLAATGGEGRLEYLLHGSAGWSVVSVATDGRDLRGPTRLTGIAAGAALTSPAASNGSLYTMDTAGGQLIQVTGDSRAEAVDGVDRYPLAQQNGRIIEPGGYGDAYVIARGSRVVYNSPDHLNALVVFTDGSHRPMTIEKSSAVSVNASGGAESLTQSRTNTSNAPPKATPKEQKQAAPVNNKIDCKTARQKPHIPTIVGAVPGSRSVLLSWTYPLLDPQDCAPSTYEVGVKLLSDNAPSPPSTVRVQGQQSVNLAGLFPSTQYELTVTAYINGQGTASQSRRVTTGPEGPAAPKQVSAVTDSSGNWNVTFSSCGAVQKGCVAAASWKVIPEFCDGRGLSGAPSPVSVTADPTSVVQPPAQLRGGDALLGRGLRFQVEGTGTQGTVGDPSGYTACTYSWSAPVASDLSLSASTKPLSQLGSTTSATVTLDGADSVHATGGVGAMVTYTLLSDGSTVKTIGPTTQTSVTFDGISAGRHYQAQASVAPPRHREAAVTIGPIQVDAAIAPWPTISARVVSVDDDSSTTQATYKVQISGVTSAAARGETFDVIDGLLLCGSNGDGISANGIDPADVLTFTADRTQNFYGSCTVRVQLRQDKVTDPPLFGAGTTSNVATTPAFTIAAPSLPALGGDGNFSARWSSTGSGSLVTITAGNVLVSTFGHDYDVSVTAPDGAHCGGYTGAGGLQTVAVPQSCVDKSGASGNGWTVTISHFVYFGADKGPYTVTGISGGAAPSYSPPVCDPGSAGLAAAWSGTSTSPSVTVSIADASKVKDCSGWSYTVNGPTTTDCGTANTGAPPPSGGLTIPLTCTDTPALLTWKVSVTYQGTDGSTGPGLTLTVLGTPPN